MCLSEGPDGTAEQCRQDHGAKDPDERATQRSPIASEQGRQQSISRGIVHATRSAAQGVIEWCCSRG